LGSSPQNCLKVYSFWRGRKAHPKIQEATDGSLLLNFGEYGKEIEVACFSGDGRRVLIVEKVNSAEVWEVATRRRVGVLRPTSPLEGGDGAPTSNPFVVFIEAAALDYTGENALLGLNDGTAGVFAVESGDRLSTLHHPDRQPAKEWELIRAVNFSLDGRLALVGFYGRAVGVWEGQHLRQLLQSPTTRSLRDGWERDTLVSGVSVSADGRLVMACCADGVACVWKLDDGSVVTEAVNHVAEVVGLRNEVWATSDGSVYRKGGEVAYRQTANWDKVAFHPDRLEFLALASRVESGAIIEQHPDGGVVARVSARHSLGLLSDCLGWARSEPVYPVSFEAIRVGDRILEPGGELRKVLINDEFLVVQVAGGAVWYRLPDCQRVGTLVGNGLALGKRCLAFSTSDRLCAVRLDDGQRWECPYENPPDNLAWAPDETWLAGHRCGKQPELTVFDLADGLSVRWRQTVSPHVRKLFALTDGRVFCLGGGMTEHAASTGEQLRTMQGGCSHDSSTLLLPGHRLLVSIGSVVVLWDLDRGEKIDTQTAPGPRPKDGIWDLPGGPYLARYDGPRGWASSNCLSPDGRFLLAETRGGAVWLDVNSGQPLTSAEFPDRMRAGHFFKDGARLLTSSGQLVELGLPPA